ncbi:MAG: phosphate acyltransferase PlsX [Clostridia bacterium]|nr:phosphate acyltransferase PlsX [Clostridia bacterium]
MRIAVDVMSGDNPPEELIKGALSAANDFGVEVLLIGASEVVDKYADEDKGIYVKHANTVVTMEDSALSAIKEKDDSSVAVGAMLLKNNEADALVSAGNTGALISAASIRVRRVKGIRRAAIGTVVPLDKPFIIVDAGANPEVLPENLLQFAHMGALYAERVLGIKSPRVGLLSNGTEEIKGTPITKETYGYLKESDLNFVGNVESRDLPAGICDVLVCDGFTGNITLKLIEGMGKFMSRTINSLFRHSIWTKIAYLACKKEIKKLRKRLDAGEYGGAPILGISKPVIKAHGNSDAKSMYNAIRQAKQFAESGIIQEFENRFRRNTANESKDVNSPSAD